MNILIVSAWWPEIRALHALLNRLPNIENNSSPMRVSEEETSWLRSMKSESTSLSSGHKVTFACTGIGAIRAAALVAKELAQQKFEKVVFCGTAGTYRQEISIGSAHHCGKVTTSDAGVFIEKSYLPQKTKTEDTLVGEFSCDMVCLTTPSITVDSELATQFGSCAHFENLELYGVAQAATLYGTPWTSFLGISNVVGHSSHAEWKQNHIRASLAAQTLVYAAIFGGVGGSSVGGTEVSSAATAPTGTCSQR